MSPDEINREAESTILRRVAVVKQCAIADALGWSTTKASRFLGDEDDPEHAKASMREFIALMTLLGLSIVRAEEGATTTITTAKYKALVELAREALE